MSFDRHLDQTCPHFVIQELVPVVDRILRPLKPIASAASLTVKMNRTSVVPPQGLYAPPVVRGTVPGPYSIPAGSTTLSFLLDGASDPVVLTFPTSSQMSPQLFAEIANRQQSGVTCTVFRSCVHFTGRNSGPNATLQVVSTPLSDLLGISSARVGQGKSLYPGWSLVLDASELYTIPYRYVLFDAPLPFSTNYAEVSYTTTHQNCRRCNGSGLEFDWRYDNRGNTGEVRDDALLLQEMLKIFLTEIGSNPFHPWYGTSLSSRIGSKITDGQAVQSAVAADIADAFKKWQSVKRAQETTVGQFVSDNEYPFRLLGVSSFQDTVDPTQIFVSVSIQKRSGQVVDLTRGFRLPPGSVTAGLFRQSIGKYQRV